MTDLTGVRTATRRVLAWATALGLLGIAAAPRVAGAQRVAIDSARVADTSVVHSVRTRDGSVLVGLIVAVTADTVRLRTASGELAIVRTSIQEVVQYRSTAMRDGQLWPETPHSTRLLFSPTAIPLRKGEGYYSNFWVFLSSFAVGVNDRFTLGAGLTTVPADDFTNNVFFLLPKYTVVNREEVKVALGVLAMSLPSFSDDRDRESVGILYGVATTGSRESNLTLGAGWGYVGSDVSERPVVAVGVLHRFSRRAAFISENWFFPFEGNAGGLLSYGLRFLGDRISADLAFANAVGGDADVFFPGWIPLVGFAVKF